MSTLFAIVRDDRCGVCASFFSREASGCQTGTISERRHVKERQRIADVPQTEAERQACHTSSNSTVSHLAGLISSHI